MFQFCLGSRADIDSVSGEVGRCLSGAARGAGLRIQWATRGGSSPPSRSWSSTLDATRLAEATNAESRSAIGDVVVHELAEHKDPIILKGTGIPVRCLVFGWNPLRDACPWRLAVGDEANGLVIWELDPRTIDTVCQGS